MLSPLKGVERLSDELKIERSKASQALQDRAKLKIELEYLQQNNDLKDDTINKLHEELFQANMEIEKLNKHVEDQKIAYYLVQDNIKNKETEIHNMYKEKLNYQIQTESSVDILNQKELLISALAIKVESLENRCVNKDEIISQLKNEIQQIRNDLVQVEQEKVDIQQSLIDLKQQHGDLQSYASSITMMEEGYNQTKTSNDGLRLELEQVHTTNASYIDKIRELNRQISEKSAKESQLEDVIHKQEQEKSFLTKELHDLEENRDQISSRVQAEIDAREAATERAEAAVRSRDFLDQQILELRDAHRDALTYSLSLEEQLTTARTTATDLQSEIIKLKEVIERSQSSMEESASMNAMTMEIEGLRNQLHEVRKQLIKRDIEDEAGALAPRAVIDREQQGRQVYEKIIQELRIEIDKINVKFHESSRRCEDAMRKAARVDQLEEEIKMYKEMAKSISLESQNAALSISEAVEKSIKYSHEKHNIMHDLHRAESEVLSAKAEIAREKEEVLALREKMKAFHSGKILADKKVAEIMAVNSRLEATFEDFKQKYDRNIIELEKTKRSLQEQTFNISELRLKLVEQEQLKIDNNALSNKILSLKADFSLKEKDLVMQIDTLQYHQDTIQRELDASREKANIQKAGIEQMQNENIHLRSDLESCITERDRYKREVNLKESLYNEHQLHELRKDLDQTISEWQGLEKEKSVKDKMLQQLQNDSHKEREKTALLKMQNGILEERLKIANHELSVLRGINVYHSSMQVELQTYRKDKASLNYSETHVPVIASSSILNFPSTTIQSKPTTPIDSRSRAATPPPLLLMENPVPDAMNDRGKFSLQDIESTEASISATRNGRNTPDNIVSTTSILPSSSRSNNTGYIQAIERASAVSESYDLSMKDLIGNDEAVINHFSNRKSEIMDEKKEELLQVEVDDDNVEDQHYMFTLYSPIKKLNSTREQYHDTNHMNKYEDMKTSSYSKPRSSITEKERQEILAERAERKAIRDKQLRDQILKENNLKQRDDSSSLASSGNNATISRSHSNALHTSVPIKIQASHLSSSSNSKDKSGSGMLSDSFRMSRNYIPSSNTSSTSATLPAKLAPSPIVTARNIALQKPSKTDFDRARRLLSM